MSNQTAKNQPWLDLTIEDTLEPELPICDPHHHLWEFTHKRQTHRYLLPEILADMTSGHNVVSTVFVECNAMHRADGPPEMRPVGETEFVNGIAAMSASGGYGDIRIAAGIVGFADLRLGAAVGPVLDAHMAASARFRGIRHPAAWEASADINNSHFDPPQHLLLNDEFRKGFAELAPRELSFEGWCFPHQIPELTDLARAFPETTIIFNHFGGPLGVGPYAGKRDEGFAAWRDAVTDLAACPNVVAKLGGINMKINGFGWHDLPKPPSSQTLMEATRPYYAHAIEQFGPTRCMFESNFPVDKVSCSYNVLWNAYKRLTADYSPAEKAALHHDTAARVYRLG